VAAISVLGIDRRIVNIAVCSDNRFFNCKKIKNRRARYAHRRKELQSKGTKSAKRKIKRLAGREIRVATDVSLCMSEKIVNSEYTVFALNDLRCGGVKSSTASTMVSLSTSLKILSVVRHSLWESKLSLWIQVHFSEVS